MRGQTAEPGLGAGVAVATLSAGSHPSVLGLTLYPHLGVDTDRTGTGFQYLWNISPDILEVNASRNITSSLDINMIYT